MGSYRVHKKIRPCAYHHVFIKVNKPLKSLLTPSRIGAHNFTSDSLILFPVTADKSLGMHRSQTIKD